MKKYILPKKLIKNNTMNLYYKKNGERWMEKHTVELEVGKHYSLPRLGYNDVKIESIRSKPTLNISSFFSLFTIKPRMETIVLFSYIDVDNNPGCTFLTLEKFSENLENTLMFENELSSIIDDYKKNQIK